MDPAGVSEIALMPSTRLVDLDPELMDRFLDLREQYQQATPGHALLVTCTYRTVEEQAELYAKGRTRPGAIVTNCDGVTHRSNHNVYPARAIDFAVVINGKVSWDPHEYAGPGALGEALGLVWGGSWTTLKDYPHLELPESKGQVP